MDSHSDKRIFELKTKLSIYEKGLERWKSLSLKREGLENQIHKKENERDRNREQSRTPLLNEQIIQMRKQLWDLDGLLDYLEEYTVDKIEDIENQLVTTIFSLHPESKEAYENIQNEIQQIDNEETELRAIQDPLIRIDDLLQKTLLARQRVRGAGLLSYLFGATPNYKISQHLDALKNQIQLILTKFPDKVEYLEFKEFLIHLEKECGYSWSFRKVDTYFTKSHNQLKDYLKLIQAGLEVCEQSKIIIEKKRKDWLLKF